MANPSVKRVHPLGVVPETTSPTNLEEGVVLEIRPHLPMAIVFAAKGRGSDVADLLDIASKAGRATLHKDFTALPMAPQQWMLIAAKSDAAFSSKLKKKLSGIGHVSDQSHARVCLRVSGSRAHDLMSRGCRLDLHPGVASAGFCAQTVMAQIGIIIHQVSDEPTYDLHVPSGFARSFWHWLKTTAEQFGYSVKAG